MENIKIEKRKKKYIISFVYKVKYHHPRCEKNFLVYILNTKKNCQDKIKAAIDKCDPDRIRTCDLLIRSQLLYPAELRDQSGRKCKINMRILQLFFLFLSF